jgi:molybdate transport system ATP-binding protein
MITHDIEDVLALADVAFVYKDGQVVREIDLHNAESRDLALRDIAGCGKSKTRRCAASCVGC